MTLHDLEVQTLSGETTTLGALADGKAALLVNVASTCGLTPQYAGLENGEGRSALFAELVRQPDADGADGDVQWNFEKWLLSPQGEVVGRFRALVDPADPALRAAVEEQLPA